MGAAIYVNTWIILPPGWGSLTHVAGIVSYSLAAISALIAWIRVRKSRERAQLAAFLTIIEGALLLDVIFDWRWALHSFILRESMKYGLYGYRSIPQIVMLLLLAVVVLPAATSAQRRVRGRPGATIALWGLFLSLTCWCVEVISLHATDSILYHPAGPFMLVAFVWMAACGLTAIGIQIDSSARQVGD